MIKLFPSISFFLLQLLALFCGYVLRLRKRIVYKNIKIVYGKEFQYKHIYINTLKNLAKNIFYFFQFRKLLENNLIKIENLDIFDNAFRQNKGLILITGHYGNWELLALTVSHIGYPFAAIVRDLHNPYTNRLIKKIRESEGGKVFSEKNAVKNSIKWIKEKKCLGVVIDHRMISGSMNVDFFNKPAATSTIVPVLAKRFNCVVVPGKTWWEGKKFFIKFYPPIEFEKDEDIFDSIKKLNKILENWILERPYEWFWLHDRWRL